MFGNSQVAVRSVLEELQPIFRWLDCLISEAISKAQAIYGAAAASDAHRGLYINDEEVERLLAREPSHPLFPGNQQPDWLRADSRLAWLQQTAGLSDFDLALLVVALAPEFDLRYERLYAYLQDDVTRKRPTVDLALNLLCSSASEKLHRRHHFSIDAPLRQQRFLHLIPDPNQVAPSFLAHVLKLDDQISHFLLRQTGLDPRLEAFCQITQPAVTCIDLPLTADVRQGLQELAGQVRATRQPLTLYLQGVPGIGKRRIAAAIATELNAPLLIADLPKALSLNLEIHSLLRVVFREVQLKQAVLYLPGSDQLSDHDQAGLHQRLLEELSSSSVTILGGTQPWNPTTPHRSGVMSITLEIPEFEQRRACWQDSLATIGVALELQDLDALANRFRLTPEQISDAVIQAGLLARWAGVAHSSQLPGNQPTLSHFFTAARSQSGHTLKTLARKIQPRYTWADLVLPPDAVAQLQEICSQVKYHQVVYQAWGFERKLSLGKGVTALFSGPPGTGKTMAAEVTAHDLQLDLYKIDLSQVVSKYIGETEKNLDRIFTAAETANAILFFDEADALFGKRSEVKDAHDRYANIEVAYLLQKVEEYEGLAILASNLRQNLDEAFVRRLRFIVDFPFPDEDYRRRILEVLFPAETPVADDIDLDLLAREARLAGGNLKNIVLAAAFYAAGEGSAIQMGHLLQATLREHQKIGRTWQLPAHGKE